MTPENYSANLTMGLLPVLSAADLMEVAALALNELNQRGADVTFGSYSLQTQWGDVQKNGAKFSVVFNDEASAGIASQARGRAA